MALLLLLSCTAKQRADTCFSLSCSSRVCATPSRTVTDAKVAWQRANVFVIGTSHRASLSEGAADRDHCSVVPPFLQPGWGAS